MHVFRVAGQLYWRDGDPIPEHVKLRLDVEIVELSNMTELEFEVQEFLYNDEYAE